jgi:hypothetical protein
MLQVVREEDIREFFSTMEARKKQKKTKLRQPFHSVYDEITLLLPFS